MEWRIDPAMDL